MPVELKELQPELPSDETRRPDHLVGRLVEVPELALTVFLFSRVCLLASMARSVNCLGRKNTVQVHLIGAKPIVQVKR